MLGTARLLGQTLGATLVAMIFNLVPNNSTQACLYLAKGFAVVADQVSLLAAQSAEAAKESRDLIETSVSAVERGKVIADETAKQLEQVVESSKAATAEVYKIAVALEADAATMTQINQGVEQINSVVQTNSATSQQCAAASQEMSDQAGTLEQLIKSFKIRK